MRLQYTQVRKNRVIFVCVCIGCGRTCGCYSKLPEVCTTEVLLQKDSLAELITCFKHIVCLAKCISTGTDFSKHSYLNVRDESHLINSSPKKLNFICKHCGHYSLLTYFIDFRCGRLQHSSVSETGAAIIFIQWSSVGNQKVKLTHFYNFIAILT